MRASDSSMGGEAGQFHTTHWTVVMTSLHDQSQTGRVALAAICQTYWYPLYAFARRRGHSPHDAQDLTQGFFLYVIEHHALSHADRLKGKFCSFLLTCFQNYLSVKTLIHRLRKQYLAVVRQEVARTVSNPAEIGAEIRALCEALIAAERRLKP